MAELQKHENTVFVGKKETMAYVLAVITQLNQQKGAVGGSNEVLLKARGRAISRAVDVAEIVRNKFVKDIKVDSINISTEEVTSEEGAKLRVSSIEINLKK